ncbi:hypothetical protein CERZMDRAFT_101554 [Cercospora zeae-maydis SCOH1-5]|uniref:Uncharacterized protein n=1 Tax=Cercospora zeae-maydis SCOH1-5 TaxID=717836 RepID=A0A6A6F1D8_9PEZI|nr:hypothetical protein CERZMDRAFT_101554 [Cercospora zeae-maydis SCOH1-5]
MTDTEHSSQDDDSFLHSPSRLDMQQAAAESRTSHAELTNRQHELDELLHRLLLPYDDNEEEAALTSTTSSSSSSSSCSSSSSSSDNYGVMLPPEQHLVRSDEEHLPLLASSSWSPSSSSTLEELLPLDSSRQRSTATAEQQPAANPQIEREAADIPRRPRDSAAAKEDVVADERDNISVSVTKEERDALDAEWQALRTEQRRAKSHRAWLEAAKKELLERRHVFATGAGRILSLLWEEIMSLQSKERWLAREREKLEDARARIERSKVEVRDWVKRIEEQVGGGEVGGGGKGGVGSMCLLKGEDCS